MRIIIKVIIMAEKVKKTEWKQFVLLLSMIWGMAVFDILDNLTSIALSVIVMIAVLFREYAIEKKLRVCFFDEVIDPDVHEYYIKYFHGLRWETMFIWILAVAGLRIADIFEQIYFSSSMATILLIFGTICLFMPEMRDYREYWSLGKEKYMSKTINYEEIEIDMVNALYRSRAIFMGVVSTIGMYSLSVRQITDLIPSMLVYSIIVGIIYYTYRVSRADRFKTPIFNRNNNCYSI